MSLITSLQGMKSVIGGRYMTTLPIPTAPNGISDQIFIVTGANTGLGYESCRHLCRLGAGRLIMACRNAAKGEEARKTLLASTGRTAASIELWSLDMDSYASVKEFCARASSSLPRIDGVLANAGLSTTSFSTSEGYEKMMNVNVISTFLLCLLLLPKMCESGKLTGNPCRFTIPNSALHYMAPVGDLNVDNTGSTILEKLNDKEKFNMTGRYPLTKLLVLYVVRELYERMGASSRASCIVNTPNPSFCKSDLSREVADSAAFKVFERMLARTGEEGSRTLVHGLLAGDESNGKYLSNCEVEVPACHVTNKWGQNVQVKFFDELLEKLDSIEPGVSSNI